MHVNLYCLNTRVYLIVFECKSNGNRLLPYLLEMAVKAFGSVLPNSIVGSMKVEMNIEVLPSNFIFLYFRVGGCRECNPMQS